MIKLTVNETTHEFDGDPETPLVWFLRDEIGLMGTRYGCGTALCGCCTVHVDDQATRSCSISMSELDGRSVRTIEGLAAVNSRLEAVGPAGTGARPLHVLQQAWIDLDVPQCGYCQSGQLMQAAVLLASNPHPSDDDIDQAMSGNICRCGTYLNIRAAIKQAAGRLRKDTSVFPTQVGATGVTKTAP
jgi:isoquinoline 1-oxidoreductase alpha subunit